MPSRIKADLSAETVQKFKAAIAELQALTPYRISMSKRDRKRVYKLGNRTRALLDLTVDLTLTNPELLPRSIDPQVFIAEVAAFKTLEELCMSLSLLHEQLADTLMTMGVDVFANSRMIYKSARLTSEGTKAKAAITAMSRAFGSTQASTPAD